MAEISVFSRAHRAFRDTPRFHFVRSEPEIADRYRALVSADTGLGDAIGMYMNPDPVQPEVIFVAERGLLAIRSSSTSVWRAPTADSATFSASSDFSTEHSKTGCEIPQGD